MAIDVEHPEAAAELRPLKHVTHWIAGRPSASSSARRGDIFDPATGAVTGQVDFADGADVDRAVAGGHGGVQRLERDLPDAAHQDPLRLSRARRATSRGPRDADHRRARQGAGRRTRRGCPWTGGRRFRLRHLASPQGRLLRERLHRGRRLLHPATPRRRRRDHSIQLPRDGADVDVSDRDRLRQHASSSNPRRRTRLRPSWSPSCGREAGLPAGVFNVVHGDKAAVDALLQHPGIAAISFVGSTPVARHVYEQGTQRGKRVQALGGAKNHAVVLPDADLDAAADALVGAGYGSAGERCMAISAVVAVGTSGDELVAAHRGARPQAHRRTGHGGAVGDGPPGDPRPPRPGGRLRGRRG